MYIGFPLVICSTTCAYMAWLEYSDKGSGRRSERELRERLGRPPRPLPQDLQDLRQKDQEFHRFVVRGTFDHDRELFIGPKEDATNTTAKDIGCHVVTPFKLADRDETILINRGHVPWMYQPHQKRMKGQIKEEVEIVGVNRLQEKEQLFPKLMGMADKNDSFRTRDIDTFSKYIECSPVLLEADMNATIPGGPMAGQTKIETKEHYILWAFGAAFSYSLFYKFYKNPKIVTKYKTILETFEYPT